MIRSDSELSVPIIGASLNEAGCPSGLSAPHGDDAKLIDPSAFIRVNSGLAQLELAIFGAKCAGCISKIEKAMLSLPGMETARLNLSTGRLSLAWRGDEFAPSMIIEKLVGAGYRAAPFDPEEQTADHDREGRDLLRALAVAGFAMANIMLLSVSVWSGEAEMGAGLRGFMHWVSALIAIPAAIYAGQPFFRSAYAALKQRHANMDVPISLAVFLALGLSLYESLEGGGHTYFDAAVMLLFFLLIGRYLDHRLRWRARAAARDLLALQAVTAMRLNPDGSADNIPVRTIEPGDLIQLLPGDRAPVDGDVTQGVSTVDMSIVTGESMPQELGEGQSIAAGVLNHTSPLIMRAKTTTANSLLADLTRLIETGEQTRSRYVKLADKAAALYVPLVHSLAALTFFVWAFIIGGGVHLALINAIAVLIITCPCALGLAAPAVQVVSTGRLFRAGIFVKSGDALERMAEIDTIVFDKTGTLTLGKPVLTNREMIDDDVFAVIANIARSSRHPLSRAIVEAAGPGSVTANVTEWPGLGVEAIVDGTLHRLGRREWVRADVTPLDPHHADAAMEVWFSREGTAPVQLTFHDQLHNDAAQTIAALRKQGLKIELLSGDRQSVVQETASVLGIESWRAGVTPEDKIDHIQRLKSTGHMVAMVGDGLNDAPSLAGAHVALSPGTAADVSQATADFIYRQEGLSSIKTAYVQSKSARARVLQNFTFAAGYNLLAVPLAAFGFVTPLIAALAMSGSSIIVTLNALRPSRLKRPTS